MNDKNKIISFALKLPIFMTIILILSKFFVYLSTGSLAIFASFVDSFLDLISSCISFFAAKISIKERTKDYQYGFYAIIDITTIITAVFVLYTTVLIYQKALSNVVNKTLIEYSFSAVATMFFSLIISCFINLFLFIFYKKTKSMLIYASISHYFSDIYTNFGVLIALVITKFYNKFYIDPIIAIIMGAFSVIPAIKILVEAINNIMGKEIDNEIKDQIISLLKNYPQIKGYHKFKTRRSGERIFIQLDIELPSDLTFIESHQIIDNLEEEIKIKIENSEILIHADPK